MPRIVLQRSPILRFLTAGESHGKGLIGVIEGLPSGLPLTAEYLHVQALRRKHGYGRGARQKIETDAVEIMTGVRHGKTLGSPIALLLLNRDWTAWRDIMQAEPYDGDVRRVIDVPRPGHADLVGGIKYHHKDMRNVLERSSARETAMRVAIGSIARRFLEELDIHVASRVVSIGGAAAPRTDLKVAVKKLNALTDDSPVRCDDKKAQAVMVAEIDSAKKAGDTLGGIFEVFASGVPVGLGSYSQWDRRLEAEIGRAMLSLNAIKGVEIGLGFNMALAPGSEVHDEYFPSAQAKKPAREKVVYRSNRSGGIDGGMSTGRPIVVRAAMKPLATLMKPLKSVSLRSGEAVKAHVERSDVCAVPAAAVIGESLLALVLAQSVLEKFGGDSMKELVPRVQQWKKTAHPL